MIPHGRKNGERDSHPIPVWNGILEHRQRIGNAVWVFLWCIDRVTEESDGKGLVFGGSPVKVGSVAADLELDECSVRRSLKRLAGRYLEITRTPYGLRIQVLNSRKFNIWRSGENARTDNERSGKTAGQIGQKRPERSGENARNKEDKTVDAAVDAAVEPDPRPLHPAWKALGVEIPIGNAAFRGEWQDWFDANPPNGRTASQVAEDFIQWRDGRGMKCPPTFYQAKHSLEEREKDERLDVARSAAMEEIPAVQVPA